MLSSKELRQKTIKFSCDTNAGHLGSSLSTVEILKVLFESFLKFDKNDPRNESRDRLIFSKGHGAYTYYIILNHLGFIPDYELNYFNTEKSSLKGCLVQNNNYMIEASTGSLGHGLPIAVGMAKSFKIENKQNKVICIVGDGEMQEGSNYEALLLAIRFKLNNLLVIVDANELQAMDYVKDVSVENKHLAKILNAFSPESFYEIDGHSEEELRDVYKKFYTGKNENISIVVAHTLKGNGLKMIQHDTKYHYRCPTEDGYIFKEEEL
ncbi:1-deoxy-D-xylulose-5-phosphate synthase N-terminal domain-containing protein [Halarcobacter ebronensis]|uniref:Transketolase n=1 Tax=Halarcobacter ebronensis TaxID=1462615 RepID=A0A4Q1AL65_9BACT|nr:1-deoxy-D-xylulose-5-phosphate synthase N-terminal domain-containing protein [Halarcobacter ebronensis]QKF83318.1 transketolase [Halarcobacter ebronensis]RXK05880.1 transketolase [Halarcobacter ebronensis]